MITLTDHKIGFDFDLCQQCGACLAVCPTAALQAHRRHDGLADITVDHDRCISCLRCLRVCPSAMPTVGGNRTGEYARQVAAKRFYMGHNADPDIRRRASSGGVCRTLIVESLRSGAVDGVYTLRALDSYPMARGEFFDRDHMPAYVDLPNSVYHSVMQCLEMQRVKRCHTLMIVGTACQLSALEAGLKGRYDRLVKVCIFCKQQKTLDSTRFIAKISGSAVPADLHFKATYRGEGWPGMVRVASGKLSWHRAAQLPFGHRLWTVPGCLGCGDPFGLACGADITLMDPWEIDRHNDAGSTLITVSTDTGDELMHSTASLVVEPRTFEQICPALGLKDIARKQALVDAYRGLPVSRRVRAAATADRRQRRFWERVLTALPRLPIVVYRALCKLPDLRNTILR